MATLSQTTLLAKSSTNLFIPLHLHRVPHFIISPSKNHLHSLKLNLKNQLLSSNKLHNDIDNKWRAKVSLFQGFLTKDKDVNALKEELHEVIATLDRGALATLEDQKRVDQIARKLEAANKVKEPLMSSLLNGKWELLYTTSESLLKTKWPKFLRPSGKIYQAINLDTLRAQNMETWPFFNKATANLVPINARRVAVKFDRFKIAGFIPIKSQGSGRGQIEITYLDEDLRIARGNKGNLFILKMVDPSYRIPPT